MASTIYLQTEILYKDLSLFQEEMSGYIMGLNHTQVRKIEFLCLKGRIRFHDADLTGLDSTTLVDTIGTYRGGCCKESPFFLTRLPAIRLYEVSRN